MATTSHKDKSTTDVSRTAGDLANKAGDQAESLVSTVTDKAKEAASYIGDKAASATGAVGAGLESVGHAIRENAPRSGMIGNAGEMVAEQLESSGRYLEEHGLQGVGEDVTLLIRRNPIPAVLIGVGVGFLLARMMRS